MPAVRSPLRVALLASLSVIAACSPGPPPAPPFTVPTVSTLGLDAPLSKLIRDRVAGVQRAPKDAEAWGALGVAYEAHDFAAEALACYTRAADLATHDARWPYLAGALTYATDQAGALTWFDAAEARGAKDGPLYVRRGLGRLLVGDVERARADVQRATEVEPGLVAAWLALARVALADDDVPGAKAALERASSLRPRTSEVHALWAEVHRRAGDTAASEAALARVKEAAVREPMPDPMRAAVEQAGVTLTWTRRRAAAALDRGDAAGALRVWQDAEAAAPDDARVRVGTAEAMLRVGQVAEADAHLARTAELIAAGGERYDAALRAQLAQQQGIAALAADRRTDAAAAFERALAQDPELHVARGNLGVIRLQEGNVAAGLDLLRQASQALGADNPVRVNLLNAVIEAGLWDEAEALVGGLLEATPDDPLLVFLRGRVHAGRQRFDEAAADFARAAALDPTHETAPVNEARAWLSKGDEARAVDALRRAHERLPESRIVMQRLAWLVATVRDETLVDAPLATTLAKKVMAAAPEHPEYLELTAAAFAAAKDKLAATTHQEMAIQMLEQVPEAKAPPRRAALLDTMRARLAEYREGRRWREPLPGGVK